MYTTLFLGMLGVVGACIGSFLHLVVTRMHAGSSMVRPRSHCSACGHVLKAPDLVPIVSYLFTRGRCRYCKTRISPQYPFVEFAAGAVFVMAGYCMTLHGDWLMLVRDLVVGSSLIMIFLYDVRYGLVPDVFVVPAAILAFGVDVMRGGSIPYAIVAGVVLGGFFWIQHVVSKGRWVGAGDISIGILLGLYLGLARGLIALWIAYVVGAMVAIALLAYKKTTRQSRIPFGPFLVTGAFVALWFGDRIIGYIRILLP